MVSSTGELKGGSALLQTCALISGKKIYNDKLRAHGKNAFCVTFLYTTDNLHLLKRTLPHYTLV